MGTVQTFALCSVSVADNVPPRTPVVRYVRENISRDILYASNGEQAISPSGLSGGPWEQAVEVRHWAGGLHKFADGENYCDGAKT